MSLSKILSLTLVVAMVQANPLPKAPSRVLRRDPPAPSAYPLGDACGHEWQYLNFNPDDATDKGHLEALHSVICGGELRAISSYGQVSAQNSNAVYLRYFPESEPDDDTAGKVASVLGLITGTSSTDGAIGSVVASFVVDNLDFAANMEGEDDCTNPDTQGYTLTDSLDNREKIHFCDPLWSLPSAGSVDCSTLDPYPSEKMDSFSRLVLHEMTHYSSVGPASTLEDQIIDVLNDDGESAYGPSRVHGLVDPAQDDQPGKPEINADSYAWMSLDAWISRNCAADPSGNNWVGYFTQNPPPY